MSIFLKLTLTLTLMLSFMTFAEKFDADKFGPGTRDPKNTRHTDKFDSDKTDPALSLSEEAIEFCEESEYAVVEELCVKSGY